MEKVSNVMSVWDNGEVWPLRAPVYFEVLTRGGSRVVQVTWTYRNKGMSMPFNELNGYSVLDVLPGQTGVLVMKDYYQPEAFILNGDASVRFILKPAFNMRGHSCERLALINSIDREEAQSLCKDVVPREQQVLFHYKTEREDVLEIFGDDGFGDCYYVYESNTGKLLSARTLSHRS